MKRSRSRGPISISSAALCALDKNKTEDPRARALDAGTAAALRRYRDITAHKTSATDRVFVDTDGEPIVDSGARGLPALLRSHLKKIGLHEERPELFITTAERRRIRVHDLGGTFVTVSLANGRSESWISDRTGHRSSMMIARYKRTACTFAELDTGTLLRLDLAIPELRIDQGLTTAPEPSVDAPSEDAKIAEDYVTTHRASPAGFEPASPT